MGDREKLVKTIADTLKKELTIDAPPQRVTSSVNTRKTRSKKTTVEKKSVYSWYLQVVVTNYAINGASASQEIFIQKVILISQSHGYSEVLIPSEKNPAPQVVSIGRYYVSGGVLIGGYNPLFTLQLGDTISGTIIGGSGFTGSIAIIVNNMPVHNDNKVVYYKELQRFANLSSYERLVDSWVLRYEKADNFDNPIFFTKESNLKKYNIPH